MTITKLGAANLKIEHNKKKNLSKIIEMIDEAGRQKINLLVLPEVGLQGYVDLGFTLGSAGSVNLKNYYERESETIPGPSTRIIQEKAAEYNMYIQLGMAEKSLNGNIIFNSAALIGPENILGVFRKVHNQFEFPYFNPGKETPVFDLPFARVASSICYDLAFPEMARISALQGATLILNSTAWPMKGHDRVTDYHGWSMNLAAQANAFFNQAWVVISNHCEKGVYSAGLDYWGMSQIVNPYGKVVAFLEEEEGLVVHSADLLAEVRKSRTEGYFGLNLLQDRRPALYGPVTEENQYSAQNFIDPNTSFGFEGNGFS
jgi:predicted amidohydrolase